MRWDSTLPQGLLSIQNGIAGLTMYSQKFGIWRVFLEPHILHHLYGYLLKYLLTGEVILLYRLCLGHFNESHDVPHACVPVLIYDIVLPCVTGVLQTSEVAIIDTYKDDRAGQSGQLDEEFNALFEVT